MLPASAAVELTAFDYPRVFKIFQLPANLFLYTVNYFQSHVVKTALGKGLLYR